MVRRNGYRISWDSYIENILRNSQFLGAGNNGIVYLIPDNKVLKIFGRKKVCSDERYILIRASKKSLRFPKVYKYGENYIVRDYVGGMRLDKYLKQYPIDKDLAFNLIKLINEFKSLGFKKLDIRCKDLYVQEDKSLIVIDPKQNYKKKVLYPRHLMKGLNKRGYLDTFLGYVKEYDVNIYLFWNRKIKLYLEHNIK